MVLMDWNMPGMDGLEAVRHQRAWPDYAGGPATARRLRELLRDAMDREGFMVYEYEWWHYDYKDWRRYRIGTESFESLGR